MSKPITSATFYHLAEAVLEDKDNTTYEDINALIEQTLVSINEEYLDGLKLLWRRRFELEQEENE